MGNPAKYNLVVDQGSTLNFTCTWVDPAGAPINITGYRILFQMRLTAGSATSLLTFDSHALATGQTLGALGPSGAVNITLSDEVTATLPATVLVWDLLVESPTGVRDKLVYGQVFVRSTVTRVS